MSEWREISEDYNNPENYGKDESYDDEGRYPPDWGRRRRAIWNRQSSCCGRCGRARENVGSANVHHITSLSEGGMNELENLVGLCSDCHLTIHPDNPSISGDVYNAPVFPSSQAVPEVATVRKPLGADSISPAVKRDLQMLEKISSPKANKESLSTHIYNIEANYAKKLPEQLSSILQNNGIIGKSSNYHSVEVKVKIKTIRGILFNQTPTIDIQSNGSVIQEDDWSGRWRKLSYLTAFSEDTTKATFILCDDHGKDRVTIDFEDSPSFIEFSATLAPLYNQSITSG